MAQPAGGKIEQHDILADEPGIAVDEAEKRSGLRNSADDSL